MQPGDRLRAIGGKPVATFEDIPVALQATDSEVVTLELERGGVPLSVEVKPRVEGGARRLGIEPPSVQVRAESFGQALALGAKMTWERTASTAQAFANLVTRKESAGGRA